MHHMGTQLLAESVAQADVGIVLNITMPSPCHRVLDCTDAHKIVLSYALDPLVMSTLCAVAKNWEGRCFDEVSWLDTVVDVPPWCNPAGLLAWNHFQIWKLAKYVVVRPWMFRYCGLLMDSSVQPWQWLTPGPVLHDIPFVTPARVAPGLKDMMWRRCRGKWFLVGTPAPLCDTRVRLFVYKDPAPYLCFGLANTKDVCELTGLLERDPGPVGFNQLKYYYCVIRDGLAAFYLNSRMLREAPCPQVHGSAIIKFRVVDSKLVFGFYDWLFEASLPVDGVCVEDYHFPVLVVDCSERPQDSVCLPFAEPLLSRKGTTKR